MLCQEIPIECRDIDEITTKKEICVAIKKEALNIGQIDVQNIKSMRLMRDGTLTAQISLPSREVKRLVLAGPIRIGWVNCRIR